MSIEMVPVNTEKELEQILIDYMDVIEKGLNVVGKEIQIDNSTKLDLLCNDEDGALVIVKYSIEENDDLLFEGLKELSRLESVKQLMKFYGQNSKIDDSKPLRLVLLAPSLSQSMVAIAKHVSGMKIDMYEWEYLRFGDQKALRIETVYSSSPTRIKEPKEGKPSTKEKKTQKEEAPPREKEPERQENLPPPQHQPMSDQQYQDRLAKLEEEKKRKWF